MSTRTNRRKFLGITAGCAASFALGASALGASASDGRSRRAPDNSVRPTRLKAVLFDAFPVFDPRPVFALAEELFPGHGAEFSDLWRDRQFEYCWLRTVGKNYQDFWQVTEEALVFAAQNLQLDLTAEKRSRLMDSYLALKPWPDVVAVLDSLKNAGIRLGFLSNLTAKMLDACIKASGLDGRFEHVLSTDGLKTYKPDPRAYAMGVDTFGLRREEIIFVAFAGWDATGAKWFGYPTYWANRRRQSAAEMGVAPDRMANDLSGLMSFVQS